MNYRYGILAGALGLACFSAVWTSAQTPAAPAKSKGAKSAANKAAPAKAGNPPRTAWGDPDLQGTWFVLYDVPLERPAQYAGREFLTDAEIAEADSKKGV